ncbi:MAG: flavodoxin family protein [Pseudolabrys sp.]|nr:flavodoxin family protein [Pseudolabrys sp.]
MVEVRKGMPPVKLGEQEFKKRFLSRFIDPAFEPLKAELDKIADAAWDGYKNSRKAPHTVKAGPGFADPDYDLSVEWLEARNAVQAAQQRFEDKAAPSRILLVNGSARSEHTCPGEMSKSWRLVELSEAIVKAEPGFECDVLNLSVLASEFNRVIYPCKSCVSTAMPLCHWPCSCYPNHSLQQNNDWMNEIYPRWVAAHGVILIAPVNWYQAPSAMKLMIDRLVCADGGNPDPSSTHGKDAKKAKEIELAAWPYPRHLAGRVFGVFAHGDSAGAETLRDSLHKWLTDMGLIPAGKLATVDRFICYLTPYATSHDDLDKDVDTQEDMRNVARTVVNAVKMLRAGKLKQPDEGLQEPRQK